MSGYIAFCDAPIKLPDGKNSIRRATDRGCEHTPLSPHYFSDRKYLQRLRLHRHPLCGQAA